MTTPHGALPPSAMLMQLIIGGCVAQCISVAAHLGLADRVTKARRRRRSWRAPKDDVGR